jgi:ketopantoate reductase
MTDNQQKTRVLVVGTGGIGAMCSYALEQGGKAEVTAVLRSNYDAVLKDGFEIDSVQYGQIFGWRPTHSTYRLALRCRLVASSSRLQASY